MNEARPSHPDASAEPLPFKHLSASDAWDLVWERSGADADDLVLLDARDEDAFREAHLEGAEHLSASRFQEVLAATPRSKAIVVYCYLGHESQDYAARFGAFGFSEVYSVDGGFEALAKEHAARRSANEEKSTERTRYIVGDIVFARHAVLNDGGVPELEEGALVAPAGARGVVVQVGRLEADPRQTVYAVRFEMANGELGVMVGCLPDELVQPEPTPEAV